ncbi:MAG: hypothetical protein ABSF44_13500 [Candidatus Bathyarchaeia archaeon]|jgi:hypothetical protein
MPISNEEWNSGRTADTLEDQILAFLRRNAYPVNYGDIASGLGYDNDLNLENLVAAFSIQNALDKLVKKGTVEAKTIKQPDGEQVYYKAKS